MREIKFRGKGLLDKEWIYGGYFILRGENKIACEEYKGPNGKLIYWTVDPATVGQYTGLHDAKGVEIYEGDVLLSPGMKGTVVYERGCFWLERPLHAGKTESFPLCVINRENFKVVGNVHDTKGDTTNA